MERIARCIRRVRASAGMTVLEVLVSVVILSVAATAFLRFIAVGDRARIKSLRFDYAVGLAGNEAERLKAHAGELREPADTTYETQVDNLRFIVERRVVRPEFLDAANDTAGAREVEIAVRRAGSDTVLVALRVLQPFAPGAANE